MLVSAVQFCLGPPDQPTVIRRLFFMFIPSFGIILHMKEILIIGSVHTEIRARVKELPKGNEEFEMVQTEYTPSGTGFYTAAACSLMGFPYKACAVRGQGIYGEYASQMAEQYGIGLEQVSDELQGCTYYMYDGTGSVRFSVPGCEYDFDRTFLAETDGDEISAAVIGGEMLCGDDAEEIIEVLQELEKPVYYVPAGCSGETEPYILQALFDLSPVMIISGEEASALAETMKPDIRETAEALYALTQNTVIVNLEDKGIYCYDGEESFLAEADVQTGHCAGGYICAVNAGVDQKNSIAFAREYAQAAPHDLQEGEHFRRRLAGMILHR